MQKGSQNGLLISPVIDTEPGIPIYSEGAHLISGYCAYSVLSYKALIMLASLVYTCNFNCTYNKPSATIDPHF